MRPEETSAAVKPAVVAMGAAFGDDPSFAACAERFGFGTDRWPLYFGGRAGVLGAVPAEVVGAACGFFGPELVGPAWAAASRTGRLGELVQADVGLCARWAERHLTGLDRAADLTTRVVEAADASGRVLFAAWRAQPEPDDRPSTRLALNLLRLREHRGSSHLGAVIAEGLTPVAAILAGPGARKARANGWRGPYPEPSPEDVARLAAAERRTELLAGQAYAVLDREQRVELVTLLDGAYRRWRGSGSA
ncbi:hypothetical protein GCM10010168_64410 [Actinoplanes ianthinogenes]|uniref:Uncharacterized protein n=1 Tax=Actinoplanes ianthinogenes TaxID=122358 RepID=A0ABM7MA52_9ACTN|nr:hypothetical protein [Actinoplanes ianthinogenes]BCJ48494.1 hypothetical protein Aiant_91510 [Actinoplanes ianthinogenes]GGR36996.1 hypothetical protein GCM10010168_64410 [Actinoplanes ianthinogenes]